MTTTDQARKVMFSAAIMAVILFILETIASKLTLYFLWPWFDMLMHALGGMTVALAFIAGMGTYFPRQLPRSIAQQASIVSAAVLLVGLLWEVFEYVIDRSLGTNLQPGRMDTLADLCFDIAGALVVVGIIALYTRSYEK